MTSLLYAILTRAERLLRTDIRYLLRGGAWLSIGQGIGMASGFILSIAFGNLVSKEVFGNYKFVFSLAGLFGTFSLTAIGTAVTQAVARGFEGALAQGIRASLLTSVPSVFLMLGAAFYYYLNGNLPLSLSLVVVACCAPLIAACNLSFSYLKGKKDFRRDTLFGIGLSVFPTAAVIGALFFTEHVPLIIAAYFFPAALFSYTAWHRTLRAYRPGATTDPATVRYGFNLSVINVLGRLASYLDKVLVFHFLGAAPLAIYSFAASPPQYVLRLNGIFKTLALPKLAVQDIPTLKRTLPRKILWHFAVSGATALLYIIFAPYFFAILFPQYAESVIYSQVLALSILSAPGVWLGQTLTAHMRQRELFFLNTISPITKILLFVILIPLYGLWGLIGATLFTHFFGFILSFVVFRRL